MCDDVQIIGLHNDDVIVFFVDDDTYDMEDIEEAMEKVEYNFPNNKIITLPSDMIDDIKVFSTNDTSSLTMKIADNGINKNMTQIDWGNMSETFLNADYGLTEIHP